MLLGFNKSRGIEKLDKEPTLEWIEKYTGGALDAIELERGINLIYNEFNVLASEGVPTLLIKYSDTTYFDYLSDILIFGDFVFTALDELGGNKNLDSSQEVFILEHLCNLDEFSARGYLKAGLGIIEGTSLKVLDMRVRFQKELIIMLIKNK